MKEVKRHESEFRIKSKKSKKEPTDVLDILLDEDNKEPIVLSDEEGKIFSFEQIAVIPYEKDGEDKIYAVLKPIDKIEGINDDEAIVFVVEERPEGAVLLVESDEEVAKGVFEEYYDLLEEEANDDRVLNEINERREDLKKYGSNLIDELLDENNNETIELIGPDDKKLLFVKEDAFLYNYLDEEKCYAALQPVDEIDGKKDIMYFSVETNSEGKLYLKVVSDLQLETILMAEVLLRKIDRFGQ